MALMIKVRLHGYLIFKSGSKTGIVEFQQVESLKISDIIERLLEDDSYLSIITINGVVENDYNTICKDGDFVEIYPIFGGG